MKDSAYNYALTTWLSHAGNYSYCIGEINRNKLYATSNEDLIFWSDVIDELNLIYQKSTNPTN